MQVELRRAGDAHGARAQIGVAPFDLLEVRPVPHQHPVAEDWHAPPGGRVVERDDGGQRREPRLDGRPQQELVVTVVRRHAHHGVDAVLGEPRRVLADVGVIGQGRLLLGTDPRLVLRTAGGGPVAGLAEHGRRLAPPGLGAAPPPSADRRGGGGQAPLVAGIEEALDAAEGVVLVRVRQARRGGARGLDPRREVAIVPAHRDDRLAHRHELLQQAGRDEVPDRQAVRQRDRDPWASGGHRPRPYGRSRPFPSGSGSCGRPIADGNGRAARRPPMGGRVAWRRSNDRTTR
ncbi:hypothetical protein ACE2AJ_08300 [Aquihabitans daechungensis]|uniref:hypothetical protein n=1 Tax=Aquihabitans daechungensis TaxID=1052257 RepID=UPI003BA138EB